MNNRSMLYPAVEYSDIKALMAAAIQTNQAHDAFILKHASKGNVEYEHITYAKFGEDIQIFGTALLARGYGGKRLAVIGKNSYPWIAGYFAGLNGGMVVVPLDKGLPLEEVESCLIRSRAEVLLFDPDHEEVVRKIMDKN